METTLVEHRKTGIHFWGAVFSFSVHPDFSDYLTKFPVAQFYLLSILRSAVVFGLSIIRNRQ